MVRTPRWAEGRCKGQVKPPPRPDWPEPAMVATWKFKRCLEAATIEEARSLARGLVDRLRI